MTTSPPTKRRRLVTASKPTENSDEAIPLKEHEVRDQTFVAKVQIDGNFSHPEWMRKTEAFPPGYRFCPFDSELIVYYLQKKVNKESMPYNKIQDVDIYKHNPEYLAGQYQVLAENIWYFFSSRDRKYRNGKRPNRAAGNGYWKATGADKPVEHEGVVVGKKKSLVFYLGKPPNGNKTDWIMHEYTVDTPPRIKKDEYDMRLDDWVLCKIYKKASRKSKKAGHDEQDEQDEQTADTGTLMEEEVAEHAEHDDNLVGMNHAYNIVNSYIQEPWIFAQPPFLDFTAYHQQQQQIVNCNIPENLLFYHG